MGTREKYDVNKLGNPEVREEFVLELKNRFSCLAEGEPIDELVRSRRWKWLGNVLRMTPNTNLKVALTWTPEGKRNRGRPRETWKRTVLKERAQLGFSTWNEAKKAARDR